MISTSGARTAQTCGRSSRPAQSVMRADWLSGRSIWWLTSRERKLVEDHRLRLATMVESSRDPIIGTTPDGIVISWNRGAERLFGYRAHEVVGESISVIHPPGQSDELAHIAGRLRRGETIDQYEAVRVRKDGQLVDVSLTISPIQDSLGNVVGNATVVRDITEARRSEAALRASEERLRTVLANAPLILFAFDRDGRYTVRTGRALAGLATDQGISATEPTKRSTDELYEDQSIQVQANIRRVLAGESFSSLVEVDGRVFDCAYSPDLGCRWSDRRSRERRHGCHRTRTGAT